MKYMTLQWQHEPTDIPKYTPPPTSTSAHQTWKFGCSGDIPGGDS